MRTTPFLLIANSGSGAFTPASVSDLKIWLAGDYGTYQTNNALTTAATADGDPVGSWDNQVLTVGDAFAMDDTFRPLLKTGANGINSLPVLLFDRDIGGAPDRLAGSTLDGLPFPLSGNGLTVFAVIETPAVIGTNSTIIGSGAGFHTTGVRWSLADGSSATEGRGYAGAAGGTTLGTWSLSTSTKYILCWRKDTVDWRFWNNGSSVGSPVADTSMPSSDFYASIGSERAATGVYPTGSKIGELLCYGAALSTQNIDLVFTYLNTKWAIY